VAVSGSITGTQGIVALAAAAVAVVALLGCVYLVVATRRLRRAQRVLLGESGERDLADHAVELQAAFLALREYVEDVSVRLEARLAAVEAALQGAIAYRALVRYDAYNEQSGQQSFSIAILDDTRSGLVLSCIHHREQARVYAKQVDHGEAELALSPEEEEAVRLAVSPALRAATSQAS
jgi:Protein of unknown function (DUF4446)